MASGGAAGFLEEWKAKREKMRAKSLYESGVGTGGAPGHPARNGTDGSVETSVTTGDRGSTNRGATGRQGERKIMDKMTGWEDETRAQGPTSGSSRDVEPRVCTTGASTSPQTSSPSPVSRERKTMGASARKAKGKMEKRKMREKRRSTGVVNLSAQESPDEDEEEPEGEKVTSNDQLTERDLTKCNTAHNEVGTRSLVGSRSKGVLVSGMDESVRGDPGRQVSSGERASSPSHCKVGNEALEKRLEDLEKELLHERKEREHLCQQLAECEQNARKLRTDITLLNRELDDLEDDNEQLREENKTLLRVVGQLTQ
uniref:PRKC apoptosis WT1 regulator protein isoform X2 n=1 Tax=Myxine glutinosa TaxID=7769 RepID=UPI00358E7361